MADFSTQDRNILIGLIGNFCMLKRVGAIDERIISAQADILLRHFNLGQIKDALEGLFFEINTYPDASYIAKKIKENSGVADHKSSATRKAADIINIIHRCSFDIKEIKKELGEAIYNAIGGARTIEAYGNGDLEESIFRAQARDAIGTLAGLEEKTEIQRQPMLSGTRMIENM